MYLYCGPRVEEVKAFLRAPSIGSDLESPRLQVSVLRVKVELPEADGEESGEKETCVAVDQMPSSNRPHFGSWGWSQELNI